MDDGLWALGALAARGVHVLNEPASLLAAHDKLLTARLFRRRSIPHPVTIHVRDGRPIAEPRYPVVLKPRFGSWGLEVCRCEDRPSLVEALARVRETAWYRRHGALVQELVPPQGYDLRVLVAAERVVGAVYRVAAEGEWRTNVALGGVRRPVIEPPLEAFALAVAAARATGSALVGVDLLPDPSRRLDRRRAERGRRVLARVRRRGATSSPRPRPSSHDAAAIGQTPSDVFEIARPKRPPTTRRSGRVPRRAATLLRARRRSSVG